MGLFGSHARVGSSAASDYEIEKSLRFNDPDDAVLTRTAGTSTSQYKFTFSTWVKLCRGSEAAINYGELINGYDGNNNDAGFGAIYFYSGALRFAGWSTNYRVTSRLFRDCSSWYHVIVAVDTTLASAGNRVKIYINGVEETAFATTNNPGQNDTFGISNNSAAMRIGMDNSASSSRTFDGYMAETHFIDGQQLTAASFGKTDTDTGQWIPQKYAGTYGNNGFYLDFKDNSGTTATTLGKDSSGNSNNFTPNNFSVATDDEIACDSFSDTPTNNWCTMNIHNNPNGATVNNGGLEVNLVYPHGDNGVYASFGVTSGKWYWEAKCTSAGNRGQVGVTDAGHKSGSNSGYNYSVATRHTGSTSDTSGTSNSNLDAVIDSGNWVTFCFDADNGQIWYSREAAPNISGTANVTGLTLGAGRAWQPHIRETGNPVSNFTFNFGASAAGFKYGPPNDDYKALNAANLSAATIKKGTDYFNTLLYEGNSTDARAITGVGFGPNLVWIKNRDDTDWHNIYDTVRGAGKRIAANSSSAEHNSTDHMDSIDADGFTLKDGDNTNQNNESYVAWNWKESASAGFDIVGYTGNGSNRTIAHSLGVAPECMLVKNRSVADSWQVYHQRSNATPEDYTAFLDQSGAFYDDIVWNDTKPTSSVFHLGVEDKVNANGEDFVNYLFTGVDGFSKFGSYVGNGSANGPFVYTGFKPAWLLVKGTGGSHWLVQHDKVEGYNPTKTAFLVNANNAEEALDAWATDFVSNGFKVRGDGANRNQDGVTFVYMAFAESPFKYANAG